MNFRAYAIPVLLVASIAVGAWLTRDTWQPWLGKDRATEPANAAPHATHGSTERVKLSPQARANLRLVVKPVQPQTFRRHLQLPGTVIERRTKGDRGFVAPVAGIVLSLAVQPGDTVRPGDELLKLRVNSEALQASQTELYKNAQEVKITEDQKQRLEKLAGGSIPQARVTELLYQLERLNAARKAYRADLTVKGLTPEQLDQVETGRFLKEITVRVIGGDPKGPANPPPPQEVEDVKVQPGEQVQPGQLLGTLANHQNLFIEGRGFREDTSLLEKTATLGWSLTATFLEERESAWQPVEQPLKILYLANTIDMTSQTFPFFVPLANQHREYTQGDKQYRIWRFRPGQRVQLGVPVEEFENVFVLPISAVVRDGADAYVFRQNGDYFERKPVHVIFEDSRQVALANDGSLTPGSYIAQTGAETLNRALKAQAEGGGGGGHEGHGHPH